MRGVTSDVTGETLVTGSITQMSNTLSDCLACMEHFFDIYSAYLNMMTDTLEARLVILAPNGVTSVISALVPACLDASIHTYLHTYTHA